MSQISEEALGIEQTQYEANSKLRKIKTHVYPLQALPTGRDFERLVYYLFKNRSEFRGRTYETAWLMDGVKDRGRDILLRSSGVTVGVLQCKKHACKIDQPSLLNELLAFVIQNTDKTLFEQVGKISYYIVTVKGLTEPAKGIVDNINHGARNAFETELKKAISKIGIDPNYRQFLGETWSIDKIMGCVSKLKIIPLEAEDLADMLDNDDATSLKFFELDKIIDLPSFDALLKARDARLASEYNAQSPLEKILERSDKGLAEIFKQIKSKAKNLFDEYEDNFLLYSDHKKHHAALMLKIAPSLVDLGEALNPEEQFVLCVALYLSDIGLCQPLYQDDNSLREPNHTELSIRYIQDFGSVHLDIPEKYIAAVCTAVRGATGILANPEQRSAFNSSFSIESFNVHKLNLLFIATIVWLTDHIDVENITARSLLNRYRRYPNFGTSLSSWDFSDFKFASDVQGETLLLKADTSFDDQLIFIGLNKKIEAITSVLETANLIAYKERKSVKVKFVRNELNSVFKRQIGITVDSKNILNTLLGKKLYPKEIDAIREVIQNALDACNPHIPENKNRPFKIDVNLANGHLAIHDNGVGMDDEIARNYFAKVGRSYHMEVQNDRAIGRFGIGVFSYFMLTTSFIVDTKKKSNEPLKFKVDQESPEMFYFFETQREEEGTSVVFEQLDYKLSEDDLMEYISSTFTFSDIPIYLNGVKMNKRDSAKPMDTLPSINKYVKIEHRSDFESNYCLSTVEFDDADVEGWVGIFMPLKDRLADFRGTFQQGLRYYNKGVFVTGSASLIGEINFKKGYALKLDRNNFESSAVLDEKKDFILAQVYTAGFQKTSLTPSIFTYFFIYNYGGGHVNHSNLYLIDELLFPFVFSSGKAVNVSLKQIREMGVSVELIAVDSDLHIPINNSRNSGTLLIPVVRIFTDRFYINYFRLYGFQEMIVHDDQCSYIHFRPGNGVITSLNINIEALVRQCEFAKFESDKLLCTHFGNDTYYNVNNRLIKFYLDLVLDSARRDVKKSLNQLFADLGNVLLNSFGRWNGKTNPAKVLLFDARLQNILQGSEFQYSITRDVFPSWMHRYIVG